MTEWKECKLGDVIEIIGGGTPKTSIKKYWDGNIPWLSVVDFNTGNKYVYKTEKTITELGLNNSSTKMLDTNDIIISARGTVGALAVLKRPMAFNQSCYGIKNVEKITDIDFLFYLIKNSIESFNQVTHGGVFDTITRETFDIIDISLPPLPEQKVIASVLSSLDDKIDLLHRQNKTLEAMAETLFRQWFVEEADEEWEEGILSEYCEVIDCLHSKKPEELEKGTSQYFLLQVYNIGNNGKINLSDKYYVSKEDYEEWTKRIELSGGEIIISKTGRVAAIAQIPGYIKTGIGRNLVAIRSKNIFTDAFLKD